MKIIYWSDFNCPYSYIGLKRLTCAVEELNLDFEWKMKAYELEPYIHNTVKSSIEREMEKFSITKNEALREMLEVNEIAFESGIEIHWDKTPLVTSRHAHRLVKYVEKKDKSKVQEIIFKIYESKFKQCKNIADLKVLVDIAVSCGFDKNEVYDMLLSNSYNIEVEMDCEDAHFNGLYSTPCYLFKIKNHQLIIPHALEKEEFKNAIEDMLNDEIINKTFL